MGVEGPMGVASDEEDQLMAAADLAVICLQADEQSSNNVWRKWLRSSWGLQVSEKKEHSEVRLLARPGQLAGP